MRLIRPEGQARRDELICERYYLGSTHVVRRQLRYVPELDDERVAPVGWNVAAHHLTGWRNGSGEAWNNSGFRASVAIVLLGLAGFVQYSGVGGIIETFSRMTVTLMNCDWSSFIYNLSLPSVMAS